MENPGMLCSTDMSGFLYAERSQGQGMEAEPETAVEKRKRWGIGYGKCVQDHDNRR